MNTYKIYPTTGKRQIFHSLTELRIAFNLSSEDTGKCFYRGVHNTSAGKVVTI